jgi:hypothetical protein
MRAGFRCLFARRRWPLLLAGLVLGTGAAAASSFDFIQETRVLLEIVPLGAAAGESGPHRLEVVPGRGGAVRFEIGWPEPDSRVEVDLRAVETVPPGELEWAVRLQAEVRLPDGRRVRSERTIAFDRRTTVLFELYREEGVPLTLAVTGETITATVVNQRPVVGAPVRLKLEIQRVTEGRAVTVETNRLDTFVGEPVSYAFRLRDDTGSNAVRLQLKPLRVQGEVTEIEIELSAAVPGEENPELSSRKERWVTSRGATSTMSLEHGDPPTGYRFLVTPDF